MKIIISKLSVENTDLRDYYLINDVSIGLELALKQKNIIENKEVFNKLEALSKEAKKLPISLWKELDFNNQIKARNIGLEALEIINEMTE
ncbi:hypothetical protein C8N26_1221 [Tenacibaculum lutimaris]|uniref:Uncharacterized protein n=1 Tax=Tenacibaculum lutimaris TaxID=285258 RepID=A0A420E3C6_9FLAO|nr:hypothetical protein [Tenacibaculum lutimaris]RKF04549.1 hypothetical protein C8N26_1221 [Tenacibaculum lutimaris]